MISVRTMKHVATSRTIPSCRSCRTLSRSSHSLISDQGRMMAAYAQMLTRDAQRQWLSSQWRGRR